MDVLGFFGEYRFLSNFHPSKVTYDGLDYSSVEHAYQAAKTLDPADRLSIREMQKCGEAKKFGQNVKLRPDWEQIKLSVMEELVKQKFKHKSLKEKLLATGDAYLEETNYWSDSYWGVCNGKGENHLGKILMKVRDELVNG
jgi:N-glycosidase YbiA